MVRVPDEKLNLKTIMNSGQCFRISLVDSDDSCEIFDIISMSLLVRCIHIFKEKSHFFACSNETWNTYWKHYFDLDTDYSVFYDAIQSSNDTFLKEAAKYSQGMRILNQDSWECLVSFIISQNNNIPKIKNSIESFCERFGKNLQFHGITYHAFPNKRDLMNIGFECLDGLGLGYRQEYVYNVCTCPYSKIFFNYSNLIQLKGVGPKVAACIALYGCHDLTQYPIDTWISKMIDDVYGGNFDPAIYEGFQGFIQQIQFYYYRHLNGK